MLAEWNRSWLHLFCHQDAELHVQLKLLARPHLQAVQAQQWLNLNAGTVLLLTLPGVLGVDVYAVQGTSEIPKDPTRSAAAIGCW